MPMLKSERGPRNVRLTILVPQSTMDDLRALRESTFQSTGDLLNNLIEAELIEQSDAVKDGYAILKIRESRKAKVLAKASKGEDTSEASPGSISEAPREDTSKNPTEGDILKWSEEATNKDEARQRKTVGKEFIQWLQISGKVIGESSAKEYAAVLRDRFENDKTYRNYKGRVNNLVRWWSSH